MATNWSWRDPHHWRRRPASSGVRRSSVDALVDQDDRARPATSAASSSMRAISSGLCSMASASDAARAEEEAHPPSRLG